jgi:hypothetical protein
MQSDTDLHFRRAYCLQHHSDHQHLHTHHHENLKPNLTIVSDKFGEEQKLIVLSQDSQTNEWIEMKLDKWQGFSAGIPPYVI